MKIRPIIADDLIPIRELLEKCNVEPPKEPSDLAGLCFVAEDNSAIIGCIWALTGMSTQAHIDYFAIDPAYRGTHIGWHLLKYMDSRLKMIGIKRYTFYTEIENDFNDLIDKYKDEYNVKETKNLRFYRREL